MSGLFKTISKSLPEKNWRLFKKNHTTIKAVGGGWFIEKVSAKLPLSREGGWEK